MLALQNKASPIGVEHCGWVCWPWNQIIQRHKIVLNSRIWLNAHPPSHPWFPVSWWVHTCLWENPYDHDINLQHLSFQKGEFHVGSQMKNDVDVEDEVLS